MGNDIPAKLSNTHTTTTNLTYNNKALVSCLFLPKGANLCESRFWIFCRLIFLIFVLAEIASRCTVSHMAKSEKIHDELGPLENAVFWYFFPSYPAFFDLETEEVKRSVSARRFLLELGPCHVPLIELSKSIQ